LGFSTKVLRTPMTLTGTDMPPEPTTMAPEGVGLLGRGEENG
jgi:hypothetical protein